MPRSSSRPSSAFARGAPGSRLEPDAVPEPLVTVSMRRRDKAAFDALQYRLSVRARRRVTQWEAIGVLLRSGPGAARPRADLEAAVNAQRGARRPKPKLP